MTMGMFDEIRAYDDHDVEEVLSGLLKDSEFIAFLSQQAYPKLNRFIPSWVHNKTYQTLERALRDVQTVAQWQDVLSPYVDKLLSTTIKSLNVSGLDNLPDGPCVFVCNHRDIAMDPLLVNYALLKSGRPTSRVAIGDNLLSKPFVSKIMRLNKSFVVKRSVVARREKLESVTTLSNYIHSCIKTGNSVWIAQKEGRAKDNVDLTDTAVLKMLHMAGRKLGWDFKQSMEYLKVIPVSLSYEWDPCDIDKANELYTKQHKGQYEKSHDEDFNSIVKGLRGYKGRVSVHFGQLVNIDSNNAEDWSQLIDESIHRHYDLFKVNQFAYDQLVDDANHLSDSDEKKLHAIWKKRYGHLSQEIQAQLLNNYSQPVIQKRRANS